MAQSNHHAHNKGNVVIFTQGLHHHAHVTGVSEASVSHARSSRSERCYLYQYTVYKCPIPAQLLMKGYRLMYYIVYVQVYASGSAFSYSQCMNFGLYGTNPMSCSCLATLYCGCVHIMQDPAGSGLVRDSCSPGT